MVDRSCENRRLLPSTGSDRRLFLSCQNDHVLSKVESIGNPAGIGKGTGFGLRERDRDGIGLGHYRLRARNHVRIRHGLSSDI